MVADIAAADEREATVTATAVTFVAVAEGSVHTASLTRPTVAHEKFAVFGSVRFGMKHIFTHFISLGCGGQFCGRSRGPLGLCTLLSSCVAPLVPVRTRVCHCW